MNISVVCILIVVALTGFSFAVIKRVVSALLIAGSASYIFDLPFINHLKTPIPFPYRARSNFKQVSMLIADGL